MKLPQIDNPVTGIFKKIAKHEVVHTMEVIDNGRAIVLDEMKKEGEAIYDKLKNKRYAVLNQSIDFVINRPLRIGTYRLHILDPAAATTVELQPDASVMKFRANTNMLATVVDSELAKQVFTTKSDLGTKLLILVFGMFLGVLLGAMMGVTL